MQQNFKVNKWFENIKEDMSASFVNSSLLELIFIAF